MRIKLSLATAAVALLVCASGASAVSPRWRTPPLAAHPHAAKHRVSRAAAAAVRVRAKTASGTLLSPCDDPPGELCGSIDVPLDRAHPGLGTIPIFFAVLPHSDPGPAAGTILASAGGPGLSSTAEGLFPFLFGSLLDKRDLLTIDLRGTGRSAAIDCNALQHGLESLLDSIRDCGVQLGASWARYGDAERAEDIEAVRAALGILKLDYYGDSGGGLTVQAYAVRHGNRLRSIVLDAPYVVGIDDAFQSPAAEALTRDLDLICGRSPSCAAEDRHPRATLRALLDRVRRSPVTGTALDADGNPHDVVVDEALVVDMLGDSSAGFLNDSELSAAARALERGDPVPLLRLGAENDFPAVFDNGDPRFFSQGDFDATFCADGRMPVDLTRPEATKRAQYDAAVARLPRNTFAPFTVGGWLKSFVPFGDACVPWPAASPAPPLPPGARFPNVPTLILTGDLDTAVPSENVRALASRFPDAQLVQARNVGHVVAASSDCTVGLVTRFVRTADRVDASCASSFTPFYGVGEFPRRAEHARAPAVDPSGSDDSTRLDRRVAGMAWAAAYDGIQHSFRMSGDTGPGLRGGTFSVAFDGPTVDFAYHGVRFTTDVAVDGSSHLDFSTNEVEAHLVIDGPGGEDGTLDVAGTLFPHTGPLPAHGTIGGRQVAVLVPTA